MRLPFRRPVGLLPAAYTLLVTKAKRVTGTNGVLSSASEVDPFGADAGGYSSAFQPRKVTSYERDPNGTDEAMFRRYNRWHARFDQPDPYEGSYNPTDPQSFNRYAYVRNNPVSFVDTNGLDLCYTDIDGQRVCIPDYHEDGGTVYGDDPSRGLNSPFPGDHDLFPGREIAVEVGADGPGGVDVGGIGGGVTTTIMVDLAVLNKCTKLLSASRP